MENHFEIFDYVSVFFTLGFSFFIGVYFTKRNKTTDDLLLGGQNLSKWPVAASMMASYVSAITILGYPAEVVSYGVQVFQMALVAIVMFPISVKFLVPLVYPMKLTSLFEYIQVRYKSSVLRKVVASIYIFEQLVLGGVVLYGPSLALDTFFGIPTWVSIFGIGVLASVYTCLGGIRAVVWTDAFQTVMMVLGMTVILVKALIMAGGIRNTFNIAYEEGRLNLFKMNFDLFERHNFFNFWLGYGFMTFSRTTFHQQQIQRISSQPTVEKAMSAMYTSVPITVTVKLIGILSGLGLFAIYHMCDPVQAGVLQKTDQIIPYFVIQEMKFIPGILGLFTSCVFSGVLSSISSCINSLTAVTWKDFLSHRPKYAHMDEHSQRNISRITGLVYGFLSMLLGFAAQYMGSVYSASFQVVGATAGSVAAVFLAGIFFPFINSKGALAGVLTSMSTVVFICIINIFSSAMKTPTLPMSIEGCEGLGPDVLRNSTEDLSTASTNSVQWPSKFFMLSYLMYPTVGAVIFILIATPISYFTGGFEECLAIPKEYLHPVTIKYILPKPVEKSPKNISLKETNC